MAESWSNSYRLLFYALLWTMNGAAIKTDQNERYQKELVEHIVDGARLKDVNINE